MRHRRSGGRAELPGRGYRVAMEEEVEDTEVETLETEVHMGFKGSHPT